ncbi:MAG: hypothetical protein ACRCUI_00560 [Polymorphobacter sp.]
MHLEGLGGAKLRLRKRRTACAVISIRPRTPDTGAGIEGDKLSGDLTDHLLDEVRRALLEMRHRIVEMPPALTCRIRWTPNTQLLPHKYRTQLHADIDSCPLDRYGDHISVVSNRAAA